VGGSPLGPVVAVADGAALADGAGADGGADGGGAVGGGVVGGGAVGGGRVGRGVGVGLGVGDGFGAAVITTVPGAGALIVTAVPDGATARKATCHVPAGRVRAPLNSVPIAFVEPAVRPCVMEAGPLSRAVTLGAGQPFLNVARTARLMTVDVEPLVGLTAACVRLSL
jgi:hypothetical protein